MAMNHELLDKQVEKIKKEGIILERYLEGVPTDQVENMLKLLEYERVLLMMQYSSRINVINNVLNRRK